MIGTVIAILGLFVSVATAVVGYRHGQRAERAQQRRDEREAADRRRLQEEADRTERIRQASWISTFIGADGPHVRVHNGSSQPVSNVHVMAGDTPLQPHDPLQNPPLDVTPTSRRLLMPGRSLFFLPDPRDSTGELDLARVTVEFMDVAGRVWQRTATGALRERISPDDAPPQWSSTMAPLVEPYREPSPGTRHLEGPPSGPLGGASQPPVPPPPPAHDSGVSHAASLRSRRAFSCLFVLGCLGAAAALAYLISQLA
ncbi:hypothetical protein [Streptomyces sp. NPDC127092]|uniref:hypothetical protein n=1 Tax=Streptomyces sp. NPDC127092 TaxID=3347135 RepID=UPI003664D21E